MDAGGHQGGHDRVYEGQAGRALRPRWRAEVSDYQYDFAVLTLEEDVGDEYGWLGVGYECGKLKYDDVLSAGYPGDLQRRSDDFWGARMFSTAGGLDEFDACESGLSNSMVTSTLDSAGGQSGSGVWDGEHIIRALVNASGPDEDNPYSTFHRTIADWVYDRVIEEVESNS